MDADQIVIAAGIGFGSSTSAEAICAAIEACAAEARTRPHLLALPAFKEGRAEAAREAAARLDLPLRFVAAADLARVQQETQSRSERARNAVGFAAVAEAAALGALAPGARLLLPKRIHAGVTVAFALGRLAEPSREVPR